MSEFKTQEELNNSVLDLLCILKKIRFVSQIEKYLPQFKLISCGKYNANKTPSYDHKIAQKSILTAYGNYRISEKLLSGSSIIMFKAYKNDIKLEIIFQKIEV